MSFNQKKLQQIAKTLLPALYLIWSGLILGVSFIATPVKFQASHLTMPVALEVGKATFHLFNTVEWVLIGLIVVLTTTFPNMRRKWPIFILIFGTLLAQTFWLLPTLDISADVVIAGDQPQPSHYHLIYIAFEILKLLLAFFAAWFYSRELKS